MCPASQPEAKFPVHKIFKKFFYYYNMRPFIYLIILFLLPVLYPSVDFGHDLVWPGEKLKALFPQAESFDQKNLYVSDGQRRNIEDALGSGLQEEDLRPSIYLAIVRDSPDAPPRKAAAIIFIDAYHLRVPSEWF